MEHIRIATYELEVDTFESAIDIVNRGLLRAYQEQPGFLRQRLVRLHGLSFLSLTVWGTRHQADDAAVVGEDWGRRAGTGAVNFRSMPIRETLGRIEGSPAAI